MLNENFWYPIKQQVITFTIKINCLKGISKSKNFVHDVVGQKVGICTKHHYTCTCAKPLW